MSILYYFIDEETRKLRPEAAHKVVAQKDHNADVIRVGIPETMDSVDLETSAVRCMYQRPKETEVRSKTATYYDTSGGYLWYDWTLQEGDTAKAGKINFSVCLQHIEGGLLTVDWNTTIGEIFVKTSYHSDDGDEADESITPTVAQRVAVLESMLQRVASGAPVVVSSASAMTDTDKIYVLTSDGCWYYYDGSAWVAGGEYGAVATDTTLTQARIPADAEAVGDAIDNLKSSLPEILDSDAVDVDLDITDPQGNVIARFADGHIQTKEFDSSNLPDTSDFPKLAEPEGTSADLYICDSYGNTIVLFDGGNVETKNFRGFKYTTFSVSDTFVPNSAKRVTISHTFKKGDRIVFHVERSNYPYNAPWNPGMVISYYEGSKKVIDSQKIDLSYTEHTITTDCDSVSMEYPADLRDSSMPFVFYVFLLGDIPIIPTVVKIKADGSGDYTNLKSALDDIGISANSVLNPYRIEIYPGRYDTLDGYTDEEIGSAVQSYTDISFVGPKLLDGMSLIGIGNPADIVLYAELDTTKWSANVRGGISTLNLQGTGSLENVTVIGTHVRYAVHDDYGSQEGHRIKRVVKNCIFRGYDTAYIPHTTYGAGMPVGGNDITFIDCDFGENAIVHTNSKMTTAVNIHLVNCKGHGFRVGDNSPNSEAISVYRFDGCSFPWIHYASAYNTPHLTIEGAGSDHALYEVPTNVLYNTGEVVLVPQSRLNLPVGTLVEWYSQNEHGPRFRTATSIDNAKGIVVYADSDNTYIQYAGYVRTDRAGVNTFSLNDYVGLSGIVQSKDDAYGRIAHIDSNGYGYIRLDWR